MMMMIMMMEIMTPMEWYSSRSFLVGNSSDAAMVSSWLWTNWPDIGIQSDFRSFQNGIERSNAPTRHKGLDQNLAYPTSLAFTSIPSGNVESQLSRYVGSNYSKAIYTHIQNKLTSILTSCQVQLQFTSDTSQVESNFQKQYPSPVSGNFPWMHNCNHHESFTWLRTHGLTFQLSAREC